ncbi:hypothetical protein JY651_37910 [Pyxidicoccus parkwayensis]|uniref:Uncharacterized protein n=1 Tax=Pyxidicoccus parkwayensis TaxID=2813578 RepID=A0ABX7NQ16_9BACT|nr:hypothetical protein [Pyxidicoccus parkwaysis]QSQ20955.1 hypothetical protein JY651_37910 [Pyxidicoccus parkwaysis]
MDLRRTQPQLALLSLLGNISLIASWAVLLTRPSGWEVVGPVLLAVFLVLRVGGAWFYALRRSGGSAVARRNALFTTAIAAVAVGLWVFTLLRGPGRL